MRIFLFFFWLAGPLLVNAQDIKQYVIKAAVPIRTIEPDSTNYEDLTAIGDAIGDTRIVMLGEQDHGDAPTFLAKTRLIKYLHEQKGFNVLAFESDFFGLNHGWAKLPKTKTEIDSFIRRNIFPIWTYCHTCYPLLYDYLPATYSTANPLILTGFDNQLTLTHSWKQLIPSLDSLLKALKLPITQQSDYAAILPLIDSLKYYRLADNDAYIRCGHYLNTIQQQVATKLQADDFWMIIMDNLITENKQYQAQNDYHKSMTTRDEQMASNITWLASNKYLKEKIIVWAANSHVAKYADSSGKKQLKAMGFFLAQWQLNPYVIGFTSYEGEAGRLGSTTYTVPNPKSNGFENWINKSYPYAFVDFTAYNKAVAGKPETFYLKGLGHMSAFLKDWTNLFNGIFFIRDMYPCQRKN